MSRPQSGLLLTGVLLAAVLSACSGENSDQDNNTSNTQANPPASQSSSAQQPAGPSAASTPMADSSQTDSQAANSTAAAQASTPATGALPTGGKVLRAMHAGGYTYMQVDNEGRQFWVASNMVNVKHNDRVSWASAALMENFKSTSLRRTFDQILFVTAVKVEQ